MSLLGAAIGLGIGMDFLSQNYWNYKNYQLQKKLLDYQKWQQKEEWQRQDNAVQRRTADLIKAGMSPVLAAGNPAVSGAVVRADAPQMNYQQLNMLSALKGYQDILLNKEQMKNLQVQRDYYAVQIARSMADRDRILSVKRMNDINTLIKENDYEIYKATGTESNAAPILKVTRGIINWLREVSERNNKTKKVGGKK